MLNEFNPKIEYVKGILNRAADALSRLVPKEISIITSDSTTKDEIIEQIHAGEFGCHFGIKKTYDKLRARYSWVGMYQDTKEFIKQCKICQENKQPKHDTRGKMYPVVAEAVWRIIGVDIIGPLPQSPNFDHRYILIVVDYFSKYVELIPLKTITATKVINKIHNKIIRRYGVPAVVVSDSGSQFTSDMFQKLCNSFGIFHHASVPYHQQGNGQVERTVQTIKKALIMASNNDPNNWKSKLSAVAGSYNMATHESTKLSPYQVLFGTEPVLPVEIHPGTESKRVKEMQKIHAQALSNNIKAKEVQEKHYNSNKKEQNLKPGQQVMVRRQRRTNVFEPLYDGPYEIQRVENGGNVVVDTVHGPSKFNVSQVKEVFTPI